MVIEYYIEKYPLSDGRVIDVFQVKAPYQNLVAIKAYTTLEDLDEFMAWLLEMIEADTPDCSEPGAIIDQGFLFGSKKSQLVDLVLHGPSIRREVFDTQEFVTLCRDWRRFLSEKLDETRM